MSVTPERASELCLTCGRCCRVVLGLLPAPPTMAERIRVMLWAAERGLTRAHNSDRDGLWGWFIPSVCPRLDEKTNKCTIYENRPDICRKYDGATAPDIDCLWKGEV